MSSPTARRLLALGLGTIAALVLAEVTLQAGALVVRWSSDPNDDSWLTGSRRILCVGDSNTRGLFVARDQAYPAQLEQLWNSAHADAPIEVLNVAWPGFNSSRLVRELPRLLQIFDPEVVIVLIGNNDYWFAPVQAGVGDAGGDSESLLRHFRLYKLFFLVLRTLEHRELEVISEPGALNQKEGSATFRYGDEEFALTFEWLPRELRLPLPQVQRSLRENLLAIRREVEATSARLIFLNYPSREKGYGVANTTIARAAMASKTPLVDVSGVAQVVCPEEPCPEWFFEDSHPRPPTYRLMAEEIVKYLSSH